MCWRCWSRKSRPRLSNRGPYARSAPTSNRPRPISRHLSRCPNPRPPSRPSGQLGGPVFTWLRYLKAIPQVIGLVVGVLDLVRHAEDLLAGDQRGAEKKALVLGLLD